MRTGPALTVPLLVLILAGCAATAQSTKVTHSGFLADYSLLSPGDEDDAAFRYWEHDIDWSAYDKILLDPVTLWGAPATAEMPNEDLQRLANNLYGLMYQELSKDYTMVSEPQYGTLRIQFALTGAERSNPALDVVSTVVPSAFVLSSAAQFVTGEPTFGGDAMVEARVTDSVTSQTLGAVIDRRVGGKDLGGSHDSWDDVNAAFIFWSQLTRFRLCDLRGGDDCVPPG